jgi:hypothetical protein
VQGIQLVNGNDQTAPVVMAITLEATQVKGHYESDEQ